MATCIFASLIAVAGVAMGAHLSDGAPHFMVYVYVLVSAAAGWVLERGILE